MMENLNVLRLGVNIDHVATLRQARRGQEPDPVAAAGIAELAGADGITVHLREDRRHIQERDLKILKETVKTKLNLEMACTDEMIDMALKILPEDVCLVPEKREELTTEGGLNVAENYEKLIRTISSLERGGINVSIFIDSVPEQLEAAKKAGAKFVEINTGKYSNAKRSPDFEKELRNIKHGVAVAKQLGLRINAGHGLDYKNVSPVASITEIEELNIGHSIISRAVFTGLFSAVRDMKNLLEVSRRK
jgi:pyridoxine 5-phosphate synthase